MTDLDLNPAPSTYSRDSERLLTCPSSSAYQQKKNRTVSTAAQLSGSNPMPGTSYVFNNCLFQSLLPSPSNASYLVFSVCSFLPSFSCPGTELPGPDGQSPLRSAGAPPPTHGEVLGVFGLGADGRRAGHVCGHCSQTCGLSTRSKHLLLKLCSTAHR